MIVLVLIVLGLVSGSFVNALVWRLHEKKDFISERSECPNCHHLLSAWDLIPVLSWILLKGKCRYCHKPISLQYPLVEAASALLFIFSYIFWPQPLHGAQVALFILWLIATVCLAALFIYDIRWMLLPNTIVFVLALLSLFIALISIINSSSPLKQLVNELLGALIGGGVFYVLYQASKGRWIGGGDVKLGFALGLIAGSFARSLLLIFTASVLGTAYSLPYLITKKLKKESAIPYGPFLIVAIVIVQLAGAGLISWYRYHFISAGL